MKTISKLFDIGREIDRFRTSPVKRLIFSIVSFFIPALAFIMAGYTLSQFTSGEVGNIVWAFLCAIVTLALFIALIEFTIYQIAIFVLSIKGLVKKEKVAINIICIVLFLVYIGSFVFGILSALN